MVYAYPKGTKMAANDGGAAALKRKQDVEVAKKVEPSPSKPEPKAPTS